MTACASMYMKRRTKPLELSTSAKKMSQRLPALNALWWSPRSYVYNKGGRVPLGTVVGHFKGVKLTAHPCFSLECASRHVGRYLLQLMAFRTTHRSSGINPRPSLCGDGTHPSLCGDGNQIPKVTKCNSNHSNSFNRRT